MSNRQIYHSNRYDCTRLFWLVHLTGVTVGIACLAAISLRLKYRVLYRDPDFSSALPSDHRVQCERFALFRSRFKAKMPDGL